MQEKLRGAVGPHEISDDDIAVSVRATLAGITELMSDAGAEPMLSEFLLLAARVGPLDGYKVFSAEAIAMVECVERDYGVEERRRFLRSAIVHATLATVDSARFHSLPARVAAQQRAQLLRIASDADSSAEWLDIHHDLFQKELGLAMLRLYAAGAQLIDFRCGIPRNIVLRGGFRKVWSTLRALRRLGGFRSYFQIHTHQFMLGNFNEEGWNECYRCCSELYSLHPEVLGMFGASWFYDPALETVSPRLSYLRKVPQEGGAGLFLVKAREEARANSLSTSPSRRKLFEEGRYLPTTYMLIWGREDQSRWASEF